MPVLKFITKGVNNILDNKIARSFLLVVTGIFAGYTLQKVPVWLNDLFNDSDLFKFFIIFFILAISDYPLEESDIFYMIFLSVFILAMFDIFRQVDHVKNNRKNGHTLNT
jgi:hypothetical protein